MLGVGGDVGYGGCEPRIESIVQCTKRYCTILRKLKKCVCGGGGGGGGAIFEQKTLFLKKKKIKRYLDAPHVHTHGQAETNMSPTFSKLGA